MLSLWLLGRALFSYLYFDLFDVYYRIIYFIHRKKVEDYFNCFLVLRLRFFLFRNKVCVCIFLTKINPFFKMRHKLLAFKFLFLLPFTLLGAEDDMDDWDINEESTKEEADFEKLDEIPNPLEPTSSIIPLAPLPNFGPLGGQGSLFFQTLQGPLLPNSNQQTEGSTWPSNLEDRRKKQSRGTDELFSNSNNTTSKNSIQIIKIGRLNDFEESPHDVNYWPTRDITRNNANIISPILNPDPYLPSLQAFLLQYLPQAAETRNQNNRHTEIFLQEELSAEALNKEQILTIINEFEVFFNNLKNLIKDKELAPNKAFVAHLKKAVEIISQSMEEELNDIRFSLEGVAYLLAVCIYELGHNSEVHPNRGRNKFYENMQASLYELRLDFETVLDALYFFQDRIGISFQDHYESGLKNGDSRVNIYDSCRILSNSLKIIRLRLTSISWEKLPIYLRNNKEQLSRYHNKEYNALWNWLRTCFPKSDRRY